MTSPDQRLRGPARALLVIDLPVLADVVRLALNHGHYDIRVAATVEQASKFATEWRPHLVVLDMDCAANVILERLVDATKDGERLPVVALTRRGDLKSKLAAFERGVDDILSVPFSPEEFVARVLALMRRTFRDAAVFSPVLRVGDLEIDILNRHVRVGDTELHLTPLEQSLLYLLAAQRRPAAIARSDPGLSLGRRLRCREQRRRSPYSQSANQATEPLQPAALYRHRARPRLPFPEGGRRARAVWFSAVTERRSLVDPRDESS